MKFAFADDFASNEWLLLSEDARARLQVFAADLLRFNGSTNLISRADPALEIAMLLEESVRAVQRLSGGRKEMRWLDVGSGGGIPAVAMLCVEPNLPLDLVERRRTRCDFLRRELRAIRVTRARVFEASIESLYGHRLYDVVSAKAVAEPGLIEGLCDPVIDRGGSLVLFQREGWLMEGDVSPGGWCVAEVWRGSSGREARQARSGYRLVRSRRD
jgi:16S rRNA (guanine527-N7)-methyltransferase